MQEATGKYLEKAQIGRKQSYRNLAVFLGMQRFSSRRIKKLFFFLTRRPRPSGRERLHFSGMDHHLVFCRPPCVKAGGGEGTIQAGARG